jgi:hypothetical protein
MSAAVFSANQLAGGRPSAPTTYIDISLTGPTSYATGGITGAAALLQAAAIAAGYKVVFTKANIMGILPIDMKGYQVNYDKSSDALLFFYGNNDSSDGPMVEVANAAQLDGVTVRFSLVVD